jgi:MFS family permease
MFGAVFLFYVAGDVGFEPGILGVIFAIGGGTSFVGAVMTRRFTGQLGIGPALIAALPLIALGRILVVLVADTSSLAIALLVAQQFISDPFWTVYEIGNVSVRQSVTPDRWQGRMNACLRTLDFGGMLLGALIGGWLGDLAGARTTLLVASLATLLAAIPLLVPAIRGLKEAPMTDAPIEPPLEELP